MSEAKHTPGPWRIGKSYGAVVADHPVPGVRGSDDVKAYGGHMVGESIANQNLALIAAAPELLEALQELHDIVQGLIDDDVAPQGFIDSFTLQPARHALYKATRKTVDAA